MDPITTLARMLKENENPKQVSMSTGIVISPPPSAQIRLNDTVILGNNQLVFASHILEDYEREIELKGEIRFTESPFQAFEAKEIKSKTKDTLKEGDEVILFPTADEQLYFVMGKAVRFE
ncbi:DUF2577 domain-containing protein [Lysinibacillus sphaericus]|uniref:DUF2577 domain-containing protein n=1 Tax=Lysinibacillus sphaericus TaxID=1421 RepID=UPI002E200416|nr:DUF2577 domain-containing protein [Lysinibacillus sphaericus]